ncbi:TRAP type immunogenic protein [Bacillus freudenreichii]|nr:TRAP type immunogenic protein [Bacillus freudenreichii]
MYKKLGAWFAVLLMVVLVAAGCSGGNKDASTGDKKVSGIVPIYTPGSGGPNYITAAGIGQIFKQSNIMPGVNLTTEATSGVVEGTGLLIDRYEQGKPAFAAFTGEALSQAVHGELKELPGEHPELMAVSWMNTTINHVVVAEDSPIKSLKDLKGKRIGALPPGTTATNLFNVVLEEGYGIKSNEYKHIPLGYAEIQEGIQNGSLDAGVLPGSLPNPTVKELSQLHPIRILGTEEDILKKINEKHPYFSYVEIDADTYKGQKEKVLLAGFESVLYTHKDTDEELVYNVVKTILENEEELKKVHPSANTNAGTVTKGIKTPFHPGAEKYFEEKGIETSN